jgi:hypothetical protein
LPKEDMRRVENLAFVGLKSHHKLQGEHYPSFYSDAWQVGAASLFKGVKKVTEFDCHYSYDSAELQLKTRTTGSQYISIVTQGELADNDRIDITSSTVFYNDLHSHYSLIDLNNSV